MTREIQMGMEVKETKMIHAKTEKEFYRKRSKLLSKYSGEEVWNLTDVSVVGCVTVLGQVKAKPSKRQPTKNA